MKNFIKGVMIFALVFINMININTVFAESETETITLTIKVVGNNKNVNELINAGIVVERDGEEVLENTVEVELGTTITIKAVDGNKSFFKDWKSPGGMNDQEFINLFGASNQTPELTFEVTEEFKTRNIKTIEVNYNYFIEIDPSGTDFKKGTVDIEVTGKGTGLYSKRGHPLGQKDDRVKFKAIANPGYEFERWEFIWGMPIIGKGSQNPSVNETDTEIEIKLIQIPEYNVPGGNSYPQNYLPVIAHFRVSEKQSYSVSFNTNGGSTIDEQLIYEGGKAVKPADPTKEGYRFIGWYTGEDLENAFDFDTAISEDTTLYAKWKDNNKTLDPSDYITNIKIPISPNSPDINTVFFHKYELEDNKMLLYIGKDSSSWKNPTYNAFLGFTDPISGKGRLMNYKLVIETTGIKEIKVDNQAENETIDDGNVEYISIKDFKAEADKWSEGIWFNDFGAKIVYKDGTEFNRSRFDKDKPPLFTFITDDGEEFTLTWEAIKVEADDEERIELTVKADATTYNQYDLEVKAGILQENELKGYKELKKDDRVRIKAEDGNKSFFTRWKIRRTEDIDIDNKLKILLGGNITNREIEFEIGDYAFELAKNYKLQIEALYKTYTIIDTTQTSSEEGNVDILVFDTKGKERKDFNSKDGFPLADEKDRIEFRAISKAGYAFDRWEFITPGVAGAGTKNPNVNLNSPGIQIELPGMISGGDPEKNYNLRLRAVFSENTKNIEEILDMEDEEFIQGYDKYQLPSTVKVRYYDESEGFEIVKWDRSIEAAELGENIFIGTVAGTNKTTDLKVIMKKIMDIKEEYKIQEVTVYNGDNFGVGRDYDLPTTVVVRLNDNTERTINIEKWEGTDVLGGNVGYRISYYQHGTYKVEGTIKGFDGKIELTLNVKRESEKLKLKVEFDSNGGSSIPAQEVEEGKKATRPQNPTRDGYSFMGWYEDKGLTREFNFDTPIMQGLILYAKWEEEDPTPGTLEIISVELIKDDQVVSTGEKKGNTFTLTLPQGYDDVLNDGLHYLIIEGTEGSKLAQDKGADKPIEEWANGNITNDILAGQIKEFIISKDGESRVYYIEIKDFEEEIQRYTVSFITNGGSSISSQTIKEGNTAKEPSNPSRNGYSFIGWYMDSNLTREFNFNTSITEDVILYAKWEEETNPELKEFTVSFNSNGGSSVSSQNVIEGRTAIQPKDPIRNGYKFINWYTESGLNNVFNFNTLVTKDIDLYAKWEKIEDTTKESPRIIRFSLLGYEGSIDDRNERITISLPYNIELRNLVPSITISEGVTISPSKDVAQDFNRTVYYTVYGANNTQKTYRVVINMPTEREESRYWDDYYENYKKERDDYYKKRGEISWWELAKEAKEKRAEEELKIQAERDEKLILKERAKILNDVGKIGSRARNSRSSLMINDRFNHIEIMPTVADFKPEFSNIITIPKDVLTVLSNGEYEFIKYSTGVVNIEIYPFMETASGLKLNLCDVSKDIRDKWNKVKGNGYIFQVESDSTKGGFSYELNLEKQYPAEKLRFVKYNYMKGNFEDVPPEKWYVFGGKLRCDKVSAGIYGIIYKD
ncbi:InlB B-repeat-containing protein [Tissierella sp.]|uniref:InlB B-repeat-containing protein n=1 Tax=Tissierella sp. TaxID=41274 RepID=UPI00304E36C6